MLGKLPLLAAAGFFVVGLVGFLLVGHPTPDWAVAPIVSPTLVVEAQNTPSQPPNATHTTIDTGGTPIAFPPETDYGTRTPTATSTQAPGVLAAGEDNVSPLSPIPDATDTPTPTATPSPSPTDTPSPTPTLADLEWWASLFSPTATPTQLDSSQWDIPPDLFARPTSEPSPTTTPTGTTTGDRDNSTPEATPTDSTTPSPEPTQGHHRR